MGLGALQPGHLIVVLVIVLLIFGPGKLPQLGKAVGDGLRELKRSTRDDDSLPAGTTTAASGVTPISAAPTVATRACPSCHGSVPVSDKFCGHCGAAMEQAVRSA
jgi:TatA/E family protein of Tat protein translocase